MDFKYKSRDMFVDSFMSKIRSCDTNPKTKYPLNTKHTLNGVPFIIVINKYSYLAIVDGYKRRFSNTLTLAHWIFKEIAPYVDYGHEDQEGIYDFD